MAWHRLGDRPLPEPMLVSYLYIYASLGLNELIHRMAVMMSHNAYWIMSNISITPIWQKLPAAIAWKCYTTRRLNDDVVFLTRNYATNNFIIHLVLDVITHSNYSLLQLALIEDGENKVGNYIPYIYVYMILSAIFDVLYIIIRYVSMSLKHT